MKIKNAKIGTGGLGNFIGFRVTDDEGVEWIIPNDPGNRHYHELSEWYKKQKTKPFDKADVKSLKDSDGKKVDIGFVE